MKNEVLNQVNQINNAWVESGQKVSDLDAKINAALLNDKVDEDSFKDLKASRDKEAVRRDELKAQLNKIQSDNGVDKPANQAPIAIQGADNKPSPENVRQEFIANVKGMIRNDPKIMNLVTSSTDAAGSAIGLVIPQDIETSIHQLIRQYDSLQQYVNVEAVATQTGSRVYEKWTDVTPLANLDDESATIADNDDPRLTLVKYVIARYAGITTITNSLLKDTSENLMTWLTSWIAKKVVVTRNQAILAKLATLPVQQTKSVANWDDLKTIINVNIDPAIKPTSSFITNQSGFNALDQVKDAMGNYLIQKHVVMPSEEHDMGGVVYSEVPMIDGKVIHVIADRWLPDVPGKHPLFFGDLKQAVTIFSREQMSLLTTNIGGGSFEKDQTKIRVIDRFDTELTDSEAVISAPFASLANQVGNVISTPAA
ncbi:MAG: phage major capsid protein [Oenococcus sp.]|uniref:phage major capsid protein n=1 Tax=Oenococcus sp. TaxID=1979414 RepID=UPI0039EB7502